MLTRRKAPFNEDQISVCAKCVLLGLVYLHAQRKIHRDIKPQNILVGKQGIPKLADFGIAGQLGGGKTRTDTMIGTPYFLAPEIIAQEDGYNHKVGAHNVVVASAHCVVNSSLCVGRAAFALCCVVLLCVSLTVITG